MLVKNLVKKILLYWTSPIVLFVNEYDFSEAGCVPSSGEMGRSTPE